MSIRNLGHVFAPRSVALIGASNTPRSVGAVLARNLLRGGFKGPIMPVNPRADSVEGVLAYRDVAALPATPDLAIIATPPATIPGLIAELGARGTKGAVVISAGFKELGSAEGKALEQAILDAAKPHLLRVVGPNCLGIAVPGVGLNATFAHVAPKDGDLAFVAQSGAVAAAVLDWALPRAIGFSRIVSLGDMADVDFGDLLDDLANDHRTRAILLYVEAITHARKFMSAARAAARLKPVVVIKAGRHEAAARAAASHTGALAGSDQVYDAAFARAGMLRVKSLDELFDAVETLATAAPVGGDRLAIVTNGGGLGVLATDTLIDLDGRLAALSAQTVAKLDAVLPRTWSRANPIDIIGDADGPRYAKAIEVLLAAPEIDAILALNCPTAIASASEAADAVIKAIGGARRPVFTSWLGEGEGAAARARLQAARVPSYATPDQALRGFMHLVRHARARAALMEVPPLDPDATIDAPAARAVIAQALGDGRALLTEPEAKAVLAAFAIPVARTRVARDAGEAGVIAGELGGRLALKILSRDISHKSDVGGVRLDLAPGEVAAAAAAMRARVAARQSAARIEGFTVQDMVTRPHAHELIVGASEDAQFGPVILFGAGGVAVEVMRDTAMALPPLNLNLAHELMRRTRVHGLLQGYRDRPAADLDAIARVLTRIARLLAELPEVVELDINPLLADQDGVIALDARIAVRADDGRGDRRFAIRPYPRGLERMIARDDLGALRLRPIKPEDEPAIRGLAAAMTPEDRRLRFFAPVKVLDRETLARLTQIDYDREMALVLEDAGGAILGVARIAADPDGAKAEFAVTVRSDLKGRGLGRLLLGAIVDYARGRGLGEVTGDILRENTAMVGLARHLGFTIGEIPESAEILRAYLALK